MAKRDVAVPIVFPDYLITVTTPRIEIDVPFTDDEPEIVIPRRDRSVPQLGHAGILFIDGRSGLTKYYEYGRYDPPRLGWVRRKIIPNVRLASDFRPTAASLSTTLTRISYNSGQGGRILGAYIELPLGAFDRMLDYAQKRLAKNDDPQREPYSLTGNSCLHFMKDVARAGGARMPSVWDPRPAGYIGRVRGDYPDLDFRPQTGVQIEGLRLK